MSIEIKTLLKDDEVRRVQAGSPQEAYWREKGFLAEGEKPVKKPARKRTTKKKEEVEVTE